LPSATIDSPRSDYRVLSHQIRDAGLLQSRPWFYTAKIAATMTAFLGGWVALFVAGNSNLALIVAGFLAIVFTQVVMLGHDAGHQQIFRSCRANRVVGLAVGNLATGLSFGWWVPKHNAHHAYPNQVDRDPDIGAGVVAFTAEIAQSRQGFARAAARWQAWLFFPLLLLEGLGLHISSVQGLSKRRGPSARIETVLLVVHAAAYLGVIFWVLSPLRAIAFIAINQALFGLYLGCAFAPNHKGMPILERDSSLSFTRRQVITARNIIGGRLTSFIFGGLNYQIEHHLFPSMPRPNLARAQSIVRAFCVEHDLPYCEDSLVGSYRQALAHLRQVGARTTGLPVPSPSW
jgi:fatty acid desaturase